MKNSNLSKVRTIFLTMLALVFLSALPSGAQTTIPPTTWTISIGVEGAKQGVFAADSPKSKIQVVGISYDVKPGQPGPGQPHSLTVTKEPGASSTQFFSAFFTNEVLKNVVLDFRRLTTNGTSEIYQTIRLTNATIAHLKQYTRAGDQQKGQAPLLEDITLVFQHVEISSPGSKTVATDGTK